MAFETSQVLLPVAGAVLTIFVAVHRSLDEGVRSVRIYCIFFNEVFERTRSRCDVLHSASHFPPAFSACHKRQRNSSKASESDARRAATASKARGPATCWQPVFECQASNTAVPPDTLQVRAANLKSITSTMEDSILNVFLECLDEHIESIVGKA